MDPVTTIAPAPSSPRWLPTLLATAAGVSLLFNVGLGWWVVRVQGRLEQRLNEVEGLPLSVGTSGKPPGKRHTANGADRTALLLAVAGDPERCRRLLDTVAPDECIRVAQSLIGKPAANDRNQALGAVISWIADSDPAKAIELLGGVPASALKTQLAQGVMTAWMTNYPDAAAQWLAGQGGQLFTNEQVERQLASAMARWSAFDPEAVARFLVAQAPTALLHPPQSTELLNQACMDWSRKDLKNALAWAQGLKGTDPWRLPAMRGVLGGWAEQDPVQAAGYTRQLLYGGGGGNAFLAGIVAGYWAEKNPSTAAQWASSLPDSAARQDAMHVVAAKWVLTDAQNASRWANALPDDRARQNVWRTLAEGWPESDDAGESAWLGGLPGGRDRDRAMAVYIGKLARSNPEKALTWAQTISEENYAAEQFNNVLSVWEVQDLPSARTWAAANGVSLPPTRSSGATQ